MRVEIQVEVVHEGVLADPGALEAIFRLIDGLIPAVDLRGAQGPRALEPCLGPRVLRVASVPVVLRVVGSLVLDLVDRKGEFFVPLKALLLEEPQVVVRA